MRVDLFFPGFALSHFAVYVAVHNPSPAVRDRECAVRKLFTHLMIYQVLSRRYSSEYMCAFNFESAFLEPHP